MNRIYVVIGSTGEYSDRSEWWVAAYHSEAAAAERVAKCTAFARENSMLWGECSAEYDARLDIESPYDAGMSVDYTGVRYEFAAVDLVDA